MRQGSETPRIFTPPLRELTPDTSWGFSAIEFAESVLGFELLPWQKWLLIHALELLESGTLRFRTVVLLVSRQNGKSTILQILALFWIYVLQKPLVISTAQTLDVAETAWRAGVALAQDEPELAKLVRKVDSTNGKKSLILTSGQQWKPVAAGRRGGRGFSGDLVEMDELREHQTWDSWAAVANTTMAREGAQIWAASNAGDVRSVVLWWLRAAAHAALGNPDGLSIDATSLPPDSEAGSDTDALGIFEWSCPPNSDLWDREVWGQGNPSMGHGMLTERAIATAIQTQPEPQVRTEVFCQWVGDLDPKRVIDDMAWELIQDQESKRVGQAWLGVDCDPEQLRSTIGVWGSRADGLEHCEIIESREGLAWVKDRIVEIVGRPGAEIVGVAIDPASPAGGIIAELRREDVTVIECGGRQMTGACAEFYSAVVGAPAAGRTVAVEPTVRVRPSKLLTAAVRGARRRPSSDGWSWMRRNNLVDLTPLVAVTAARFAWAESQGGNYDILSSFY